jgi:hypothetical protein
MTDERPLPVNVIADRIHDATLGVEKRVQTAYAIIGALEQSGWVIVRKRHQRGTK